MLLFHGTNSLLDGDVNPFYNANSNSPLDFGYGFYLGNDFEVTSQWAGYCGATMGCCNDTCYVYVFDFNPVGLSIIDFLDGSHHILEWAGTLARCRQYFSSEAQAQTEWLKSFSPSFASKENDGYDTDAVTAFRTDDDYFDNIIRFIANEIDLMELKRRLTYGNLGTQWALRTENAVSHLSFCELVPVSCESSYRAYNQKKIETQAITRINSNIDLQYSLRIMYNAFEKNNYELPEYLLEDIWIC